MTRINYIERLKDELQSTDYIAIKHSEGIDCSEYGDWRSNRQAIRDEINRIRAMTDEEYYEEFPDEILDEETNCDTEDKP